MLCNNYSINLKTSKYVDVYCCFQPAKGNGSHSVSSLWQSLSQAPVVLLYTDLLLQNLSQHYCPGEASLGVC